MIPSLIIIAALTLTGTLLWLHHRLTEGDGDNDSNPADSPSEAGRPDGCCGQHSVCEKLADAALAEDDYFDDDELDAYAGRDAAAYTEAEAEQFREVMLTLHPAETAAWSKALERRNIALPQQLRDELLMLIADNRP